MSKIIPQRELRNNNSKVIEAVILGEQFVVTRNGIPVAELKSVQISRRIFVPKEALIGISVTGPHVDWKQFRNDLDGRIDQEL
jgi:antitoxin (DNA-binding transcriptional repressor) of toxin-antitoxin stability system